MSIENQDEASGVRAAIKSSANTGNQERTRTDSTRDRETDRDSRRQDRREADRNNDRNKRHPEDRSGDSRRTASRSNDPLPSNYVSLSQIGRMNQVPLAMNSTAQALETFRQDFAEAMPSKDENGILECKITPIDANTAGIPFSLLVVSGFLKEKPDLGVGFHVFLLAGSAEELRTREESYRGKRIFITNVPGDGYDDDTRQVVREAMKRTWPGKNLFSAWGEAIASDFPSAKDDPTAISDCVKNSFAAIKTAIDRNDKAAYKLSLADAEENMHNSIHVQHRQNHIFDRGHQPVRADVVIDLVSRPNKGRNSRDTIDQLVTGTRISRVGGYWDLVYAPSEDASNRSDLYNNNRDGRSSLSEYQLYAKRFITTVIDTVDYSPTTMLLAQVTMNAAADPQEFLRAFEPNLAVGEDDLRNIGALAIEPNLENLDRGFGERIPTKGTNFTTAKRNSLLKSVIRPGTIWSIDVPECGASSWQYIDLMAAAEGNPDALDRIFSAAMVLTDGHIEDLYDRGAPIFDEHIERIHGGWHTEGTGGGQRLDIRDLDYIALLNLARPETEDDLYMIQKWGMAAALQDDDALAQSDRYETIRNLLPSAHFTQFFNRLNYLDDWNTAMVDAVMRCGLSLNPQTSSRDQQERYRETYGNLDQILSRSGNSGIYRNQRRGRDRDRYDRDERDNRRDRDSDRYNDR